MRVVCKADDCRTHVLVLLLAACLLLQELDLSHNKATAELGVVAGKALAAANTSVTTLVLAGNKLGASGGCALAASIVTNTSLKLLNLQDCGLRGAVLDGSPAACRQWFEVSQHCVIHSRRVRTATTPQAA